MDLQALDSLEYINLSRNLIREIAPGTFLGMNNLKGLDFSVNVVRKVRREKLDSFIIYSYRKKCYENLTFRNISGPA